MKRYLAQFVGSSPNVESVTAVGYTANYAIESLLAELRSRVGPVLEMQVDAIVSIGSVPEQLELTDSQRDILAVLYGSTDLRPHIAVRLLPPKV